MSDDLRTQVARALAGLYAPKCCEDCDMGRDIFAYRDYLEDADALIRELGLVREDKLNPDGTAQKSRYVTAYTEPPEGCDQDWNV